MKGYKDSTKTQFTHGGPAGGPKGAAKHSTVMKCFKEGGRVTEANKAIMAEQPSRPVKTASPTFASPAEVKARIMMEKPSSPLSVKRPRS